MASKHIPEVRLEHMDIRNSNNYDCVDINTIWWRSGSMQYREGLKQSRRIILLERRRKASKSLSHEKTTASLSLCLLPTITAAQCGSYLTNKTIKLITQKPDTACHVAAKWIWGSWAAAPRTLAGLSATDLFPFHGSNALLESPVQWRVSTDS